MAYKEQDNRIFVGGLSRDVTERQLEHAFSRYGKIIDCQVQISLIFEAVTSGFALIVQIKLQELQWGVYLRRHKKNSMCVHCFMFELCVNSMFGLLQGIQGITIVVGECCSVMLERDTGRPRGFGFLTFADRDAMEDAIRGMNDREFGDRVITVNKAQPRMSGEDHPGQGGYGGGYSSGAPRGSYAGGGDRSAAGQDDCFKCGRPGHWARDCPSADGGGGRGARPFSPPRSKYAGTGTRGDRYAGDRDRYVDDRYGRGRFGDRDRYDSRDDRYGGRDTYVSDR
ncbi:hypothetical protein RD792_013437 [Penstemon davidsonii]|uniref:Uncharacterized protein n=1 Tax=Penstemon davidsonii TaxID=160366 RepID=A0ABR0CU03_9LAMI|nr:hypothetical protein RD792_013437 [Penstemon davidsonii]